MEPLIDPTQLTRFHDRTVRQWHSEAIAHDESDALLQSVARNHQYNFQLWHQEDLARDAGSGDGVIATVKRAIDRYNQQRNDAIERTDEILLRRITEQASVGSNASEASGASRQAPMNSETAGNIIDRLSILSLKIFHMDEQVQRKDVGPEHQAQCAAKLAVLREQRQDLATCLGELLEDLMQGRKHHKVYRQMKMYNDPTLNPVLYEQSTKRER